MIANAAIPLAKDGWTDPIVAFLWRAMSQDVVNFQLPETDLAFEPNLIWGLEA